jgi:hypothetical protein
MKRPRGRPKSSKTAIAKRTSRFYRDPNHVAAQIAENYVRTFRWSLSGGLRKRITHEEAVHIAIDEFDAHWLASRDGKPPKRPDPMQVLELLRRGRVTIEGLTIEDFGSGKRVDKKFKW